MILERSKFWERRTMQIPMQIPAEHMQIPAEYNMEPIEPPWQAIMQIPAEYKEKVLAMRVRGGRMSMQIPAEYHDHRIS